MTPSEKRCEDMADVCELAHKRTVRECKEKSLRVDCNSSMLCGNNDNHRDDSELGDHYTSDAQAIFDRHYEHICEVIGI